MFLQEENCAKRSHGYGSREKRWEVKGSKTASPRQLPFTATHIEAAGETVKWTRPQGGRQRNEKNVFKEARKWGAVSEIFPGAPSREVPSLYWVEGSGRRWPPPLFRCWRLRTMNERSLEEHHVLHFPKYFQAILFEPPHKPTERLRRQVTQREEGMSRRMPTLASGCEWSLTPRPDCDPGHQEKHPETFQVGSATSPGVMVRHLREPSLTLCTP